MKTIKLTTIALFLASLSSLAFAGPGPQYWQTLRDEAQFKRLKAGDKVAYVCNECKTVSEITIQSPAQAMELCKDGATVTCPSCKMSAKVVMKSQRNGPPNHTSVTYMNDQGVECAFIAKVPDSK